jgi:lipopolysaccharide biosynthesis protein
MSDVRAIAFYLPQYHPIPENDAWWGKGFTEWTNVRRAQPNFRGHEQPRVPGEFGWYDLRDPAVREAQAAMARAHGVYGFCYYHYWFNGRRLLEQPLDAVLASGAPDFPFCVCWANENWTRRWDGLDDEILLAQRYSVDDNANMFSSLLPLFRDPRYIRVDGRPLLLVYKSQLVPELAATASRWRRIAEQEGVGDPYLVACETADLPAPATFGFDALAEFPPHRSQMVRLEARTRELRPDFTGIVASYRAQVAQSLRRRPGKEPVFRCVMPAWDNTARRQERATTFVGSSPELFGWWVEQIAAETRMRFRGGERLLFVNAWNEWGEGCSLEPDARYGRQYLEAFRDAIRVVAT